MITRRGKPVARLVREGSTSQAVSQANWMQRFRDLHVSESVADAWIAEAARLSRATLLHQDPEFEDITELDQGWLA